MFSIFFPFKASRKAMPVITDEDEYQVQATKKQKRNVLPDREIAFLTKMMEHHMAGRDGVGYETLRLELNIGQRVKSQLAAWKNLIDSGYIEVNSGREYKLSQKGLDLAATPEYKEYIKDLNIVSATNDDHQARIKKHLNPKHKKRATQIFDFLVQYGSLTALELAALVGTKRGSHAFSYGLKELKEKGYIEIESNPIRKTRGKMLRLSDKAFLKPEDRPQPESVDSVELAKKVEENSSPRKNGGDTKKKGSDQKEVVVKKEKKVKKEIDETTKENKKQGKGSGTMKGSQSTTVTVKEEKSI